MGDITPESPMITPKHGVFLLITLTQCDASVGVADAFAVRGTIFCNSVHLTPTSTPTVSQFRTGDQGAPSCPSGYTRIRDNATCHHASAQLGTTVRIDDAYGQLAWWLCQVAPTVAPYNTLTGNQSMSPMTSGRAGGVGGVR
eukprot:gene18773-biopygen5443